MRLVMILLMFVSVIAQASQKIQVEVSGMHCGGCKNAITAALEKEYQAKDVAVNVKTGEVSFSVAEKIDQKKLEIVLENAGYKAKKVTFLK
jgi:copper chaperone CopZ